MGKVLAFFDKLNLNQVAFFFCSLIILGLFTTRFLRILPSIGLIGLLVTALLSLKRPDKKEHVRFRFYFTGFIFIFFMHLLGIFQVDPQNVGEFKRDLTLKLPLLVLPLALIILPAITLRKLKLLYYVFIIGVFLGSLYSLGHYLTHFDEVNELYKHSKTLETATSHVRYSLMVAFASLIAFRFYRQNFYWRWKAERKVLLAISFWLLLFLHILAVRSGLVVFYATAILSLAYDFFFQRQFRKSLVLAAAIGCTTIFSFFCFPTFYNRFFLTLEDMNRVEDVNSAADYSLVGRVYSYKITQKLIQENPLTGVGIGNLRVELEKKYVQLFPEIKERGYLLPHNQFLFVLAAFGVLGLLLFAICFYFPWLRFSNRFEPLFIFHYFIITLSFLVESTLETQVGLTYSLVFILLPLWYFKGQPAPEQTWKNGTFLA
jgi:O-antigen ligase